MPPREALLHCIPSAARRPPARYGSSCTPRRSGARSRSPTSSSCARHDLHQILPFQQPRPSSTSTLSRATLTRPRTAQARTWGTSMSTPGGLGSGVSVGRRPGPAGRPPAGVRPKKSRSRASRCTSPRAMSAAPPASANPSASCSPAIISATRSWNGLSMQARAGGAVGTIRPTRDGQAVGGRARPRARAAGRGLCRGGRPRRCLRGEPARRRGHGRPCRSGRR